MNTATKITHPTEPEDWATYHRELAGDTTRWSSETTEIPHVGRRPVMHFGGGRFRQLANCKGCGSTITRAIAAAEIDRAELAAALAAIP